MDKNANRIKLLRVSSIKSEEKYITCSIELLEKWRLYFQFLDQNNDRILNSQDLNNLTANVLRVFPRRTDLTCNLREAFLGWWDIFKLHVGSTRSTCTEGEFVNALQHIYETKKVVLESQVSTLVESMFGITDLDKNGFVTRREYVQLFSSIIKGHDNYLGRVFDRINIDKTGVLDREAFQGVFTDFFLKNDSSMTFLFRFPRST